MLFSFNNSGIIDLFSCKVNGSPLKGGFGMVNCNVIPGALQGASVQLSPPHYSSTVVRGDS